MPSPARHERVIHEECDQAIDSVLGVEDIALDDAKHPVVTAERVLTTRRRIREQPTREAGFHPHVPDPALQWRGVLPPDAHHAIRRQERYGSDDGRGDVICDPKS